MNSFLYRLGRSSALLSRQIHLAGSIGGAAEACCLQPIDVIKTRLQLDHIGKYKGVYICDNANNFASAQTVVCWSRFHIFCLFLYLQISTFTGIYHCGETIIKEEGVRALWKGLTPFAVHLTLKYALRMGTNAMYQSALRDKACNL